MAAALIDALERPDFRATVGAVVDEVLADYRTRMGVYPRILMGLASTFGLIDRERIVAALHEALKKIGDDADDPLRRRLTETLAALPGRLRADPALAARIEAAKEELLASPAVARLLEDAAVGLRKIVIADRRPAVRAGRAGSPSVSIARDRRWRTTPPCASRSIAGSRSGSPRRWTATTTASRTSSSGASTRSAPRARSGSIEEHAGDDLQFIRVNGTVVGGLAGGGLYAIHLLLELLVTRQDVLVETRRGPVRGVVEAGLAVFRGLPFARPPVGALRFEPPRPSEPWSQVLDAARFGPSASQNGALVGPLMSLGISRNRRGLPLPQRLDARGRRGAPAGAWSGSTAAPSSSGAGSQRSTTARRWRGAATWSWSRINYRLGALGFLAPARLVRASAFAGAGNDGLLDQIAALEWVRDNIARLRRRSGQRHDLRRVGRRA